MTSINNWECDLLDDTNSCDKLCLEILGNRQKVMFIEGTAAKSIDIKLYSLLFHDYNIIPLESCSNVIQYTKTYGKTSSIHYVDVVGIIDRDRRSLDEIREYSRLGIFAPEVAEIENLFLLPEVVSLVCQKQNKNEVEEAIINKTKKSIITFLEEKISEQALLFTQQRCKNEVNKVINKKAYSIEEYKNNITSMESVIEIDKIYDECIDEIKSIINKNDYLLALKIINNKGLLPYTQLTTEFGWKKDFYIDYVLKLLSKNDETSQTLKNIFLNYVKLL